MGKRISLLAPIPGSHVITVQDSTRRERPAILLEWGEAQLLAKLLAIPPGGQCTPLRSISACRAACARSS